MNAVKLKIDAPLNRVAFLKTELEAAEKTIPSGSVVRVDDSAGRFVGWAFFNRRARVSLRLLSRSESEIIDADFFKRRLANAASLRELLLAPETRSYRLVHSEGDALPGLVIDRYEDLFVVEYFSKGMFHYRKTVREFLETQIPGCRIYTFSQRHIQKQESYDHFEDPIPEPVIIEEHGIRFQVHPGTKQKTGFFLDQRDNRKRLMDMARGKSVLDLCCHAGGFALHASRGGATRVIGIDRDSDAIHQAEQNAKLNHLNAEFLVDDMTRYLSEEKARFDIIVLDPPKQTRSRAELAPATRRYLDWNVNALKKVTAGGWLVTCSCTGLLRDEEFFEILARAAKLSGRKVALARWSSASPDHPYSHAAPETHYLKVAWLKVQ